MQGLACACSNWSCKWQVTVVIHKLLKGEYYCCKQKFTQSHIREPSLISEQTHRKLKKGRKDLKLQFFCC